ncbi:MAG: nitroreductase family protein [Desulfuromonadales bacterium]
MAIERSIPRNPDTEIDSMFIDRWSPRAFDPAPLSREQIGSLFEAARWAPSCYNEQPWLFIFASKEQDRERFLTALLPGNQAWAWRAPLLMFLLCRRNFLQNGKDNRHAQFDAGAAWMALALQARKLGLYAHAMAGFSRAKAYQVLGVPENEYEIMAAIVVGRRAESSILSAETAAKEKPNDRKPGHQVAREGGL